MNILNTILDWLFPNSCLSCKSSGAYICTFCLGSLSQADIPEHDFIFSVFSYREKTVKNAIWLLKYRNKKDISKIFAKPMYDRIIEELSELEMFENFIEPILVPIPLSSQKMKERGFNQAELLGREIARLNKDQNWEVSSNVLYKTKETGPQARIKDRAERLKNLKGCFVVQNPELIKGRNIILIDDVTTTGTTLLEAKKVLEKSGARKVIAFTATH